MDNAYLMTGFGQHLELCYLYAQGPPVCCSTPGRADKHPNKECVCGSIKASAEDFVLIF
jgi:hypothetical protein